MCKSVFKMGRVSLFLRRGYRLKWLKSAYLKDEDLVENKNGHFAFIQ